MTHRRGFLAFAASAVAAGAMVPVAARAETAGATCAISPDAELLDLCAEFHAKHAEAMAMEPGVITDEEFDAMSDVMGERWDISDEIEEMSPQTAEGARAMADIALLLLVENHGEDACESDVRFAIAALRAMMGVSA
jgi:hypothetical protein